MWYAANMNILCDWLSDRMEAQLHLHQLNTLIRVVGVSTGFFDTMALRLESFRRYVARYKNPNLFIYLFYHLLQFALMIAKIGPNSYHWLKVSL